MVNLWGRPQFSNTSQQYHTLMPRGFFGNEVQYLLILSATLVLGKWRHLRRLLQTWRKHRIRCESLLLFGLALQPGSEASTTSLEGSSLWGPICGCSPSQGTGQCC